MTKEQWLAIKNADAAYDGRFFYSLKGSGVVCRPSCRLRSCTPDRIILFDTLEDALRTGRRPCARCHPELEKWSGAKKELAKAAERSIRAHYVEKFSLDALARELHAEKSYLLRTFKSVTGSTPLEYHNRVRCEIASQLLTRPELSVSYVASAVGYASASHFTRIFHKLTGKTPSQYRADYLTGLYA